MTTAAPTRARVPQPRPGRAAPNEQVLARVITAGEHGTTARRIRQHVDLSADVILRALSALGTRRAITRAHGEAIMPGTRLDLDEFVFAVPGVTAAVPAALPADAIAALEEVRLPVEHDRIRQDGLTPLEQAVIERHRRRKGTLTGRRPRLPADHPDRLAADVGFAKAASGGRPLSLTIGPGEVTRIRAALHRHGGPHRWMEASSLTAAALERFVVDGRRLALPELAQQALRDLTREVKTSPALWPRKVAAAIYGITNTPSPPGGSP